MVLLQMISAFRPLGSAVRRLTSLDCATGRSEIGATFTSPASIGDMMYDIAVAIERARDNEDVKVGLVDLPIPVTGGTELDDWPGGIRQKYNVLYPMLVETMKALNFTSEAIRKREFLRSKETGEDGDGDAVGIWSHEGIYICTFPTPEYIPAMIDYTKWADKKTIFIIVNQQFFLDPMSKEESKDFQKNAEIVYKLESLNMRGPGQLDSSHPIINTPYQYVLPIPYQHTPVHC